MLRRVSHTFLTTGSTHGFALSSLYAPIPKSTFFSKLSFRYAFIKPKRGSSGACGTVSVVKTVALEPAICRLIFASLSIDFADSEGFGGAEGSEVGGGMLRSRWSLAAVSFSGRIHHRTNGERSSPILFMHLTPTTTPEDLAPGTEVRARSDGDDDHGITLSHCHSIDEKPHHLLRR